MGSLLAKRISSHFFSPSPLHLHHHHHLTLLTPHFRPYLSCQSGQGNELPFMAQYLISSFGFSPDRAVKVSADPHLTAIKTPDRLEAVVQFLRETGLSDAQIKSTISFYPPLLGYNVEKTLKPNARELIEKGFSGELLVQLIRYNPNVISMKSTLPQLLFWRDFVGKGDEGLLKILPSIRLLILRDIDKHIVPRINILKEYGLSNRDIVDLLADGNRCMNLDLDSLRQTIELIEELGLARGSSRFLHGLKAVGSYSKDKIQKKVEFFKTTYGWSKEEVYCAFRKFPHILKYSEEKIKSNMDFLIRQAKMEPRNIASQPLLIGFSLVNRLVPRHQVLSILAAKGLRKRCSLYTACNCPEKRFLEMYVEPYKKDVPELADVYFAASDKNFTGSITAK